MFFVLIKKEILDFLPVLISLLEGGAYLETQNLGAALIRGRRLLEEIRYVNKLARFPSFAICIQQSIFFLTILVALSHKMKAPNALETYCIPLKAIGRTPVT